MFSVKKAICLALKRIRVRVRVMVERKLVKDKDNKILIVQRKFVKDIG